MPTLFAIAITLAVTLLFASLGARAFLPALSAKPAKIGEVAYGFFFWRAGIFAGSIDEVVEIDEIEYACGRLCSLWLPQCFPLWKTINLTDQAHPSNSTMSARASTFSR